MSDLFSIKKKKKKWTRKDLPQLLHTTPSSFSSQIKFSFVLFSFSASINLLELLKIPAMDFCCFNHEFVSSSSLSFSLSFFFFWVIFLMYFFLVGFSEFGEEPRNRWGKWLKIFGFFFFLVVCFEN